MSRGSGSFDCFHRGNPSTGVCFASEAGIAGVSSELQPMLGTNAEPVHVFHRFWEKAIPQYEVGYGKIRSKLDALEASHPGLHFTGNYRGGISVADTILHALKMTDLLKGTSN